MILSAFARALAQVGDPRFRQVLLLGVGLTLGLFLLIYVAVFQLIGWLAGDGLTLPWIGRIDWAGTALSWGSVPLMLIASCFLMVPVASAFTSLFLDRVACAVEARYYPALPQARAPSLREGLGDTLSFMGILILANLLALVLYLFFPPFAPVIFCVLNGYLLGVEYFQLAAMRHLGRPAAVALRRKHQGTVLAAGILMAIPLGIPLLGLVIPILGAATFTHLFHALNRSG